MSFPYKSVVVIGATSGIGQSLAAKLVENGVGVIVVGRRKDKLDEFVAKHGSDKAHAEQFDISQLDKIPQFVTDLTKKYPGIDAFLLNAGSQRPFDFGKPDTVDLDQIDAEIKTNYTSYVHLTKAILPYLQAQKNDVALIYTGSQLGLLVRPRVGNYGATKAALHHFILALRHQLEEPSPHIKVIEIYPPAVQTELHDWMENVEEGRKMGMPLQDFTDDVWKQLQEGKDQVPVGPVQNAFDRFESARQAMIQQFYDTLRKAGEVP